MISDGHLLVGRGLSCVRGGRLLFSGINIKISPGEVIHLVGVNGSGKSSLLRMLAGLLAPTSGTVECAHDFFYMGHQLGLNLAFTIEENLKFDLRYEAPSSRQIVTLLRKVGLLLPASIVTTALSQGQRQCLALAKCLLSCSRLWLLDEPFAALDQKLQAIWQDNIHAHVQQGGALVLSSHIPWSLPGSVIKMPDCSLSSN